MRNSALETLEQWLSSHPTIVGSLTVPIVIAIVTGGFAVLVSRVSTSIHRRQLILAARREWVSNRHTHLNLFRREFAAYLATSISMLMSDLRQKIPWHAYAEQGFYLTLLAASFSNESETFRRAIVSMSDFHKGREDGAPIIPGSNEAFQYELLEQVGRNLIAREELFLERSLEQAAAGS